LYPEAEGRRAQVRPQVREHEVPSIRRGDQTPRLPQLSQSNRSVDLPAAGYVPPPSEAVRCLVPGLAAHLAGNVSAACMKKW